jgi:hypothetical protein
MGDNGMNDGVGVARAMMLDGAVVRNPGIGGRGVNGTGVKPAEVACSETTGGAVDARTVSTGAAVYGGSCEKSMIGTRVAASAITVCSDGRVVGCSSLNLAGVCANAPDIAVVTSMAAQGESGKQWSHNFFVSAQVAKTPTSCIFPFWHAIE